MPRTIVLEKGMFSFFVVLLDDDNDKIGGFGQKEGCRLFQFQSIHKPLALLCWTMMETCAKVVANY